jgi:PAS domain S-box-containing protein
LLDMSEEIRETNRLGNRLGRKIKGHKKTTEDLRTARERYRSLFENVPTSLWEEDFSSVKTYLDDLRSKGIEHFREYFENNPQEVANCVEMVRITDVNQAALNLCQAASREELLRGLSQIFTEDTYGDFREQLIALAEGETSFEKERLIRTLKGDDRYVHQTLSVVPGYEDTWERVLLSLTDITARKRTEEELRSNHEYLERLNNSLKEVIFRVKLPERTIAYVNRAINSVFGYEEDECLGRTTEFLYPSREDYLIFGRILEDTMLEGKEALHTELSLRRKTGELFPAEITSTFLKEDNEIGVISILRDITRRRQAENGLRLSEARLTEAQRIAHLGNWDWDIITNELLWSDEIYRIFGLTPKQFGATYEAFLNSVHPEDREFVERSVNEALYEGQPYDINHRIILPDGAVHIVHESAEVTFDNNGRPLKMVGTVHDITEIKRAEEELRTLSRRLVQIQEEERRTIARELHDEIGQSLTMLNLLLDRTKRVPPENVESTLTEAEALVNGLMERVRNLSLDLRPGMLDDLGLLPTLLWHFDNYTAKTQIKVNFKHSGLQIRFSPELRVAAYRIVQEALTNVVRHASATEVDLAVWFDQNILWIRIQDNGSGFDTTAISSGTSGGLFGMRERARSLGGELTIDSAPGAGTTIIARLPLSDREKESKENSI